MDTVKKSLAVYKGQTIVVKYGGNAMTSDALKMQVMEDIALLHREGVKVVLVHGGGPEINQTMEKLGKKAVFVNGLRYTDQQTMDIVQMVLCGKVNKSLVSLLQAQGVQAVGLSGIDGGLIQAKVKDPALGLVGQVTGICTGPVDALLQQGYIPVIATVSGDNAGTVYNVNGDTAAAFLAGALGADRLILMTDIAGILRDKDDPATLISHITISQVDALRETGVISGGMLPKTECCKEALAQGVKNVAITDGRTAHGILMYLISPETVGTTVTKD